MAGVCRPLSICARTVGGAALFVGVVLVACSINKPIYVAHKAVSLRPGTRNLDEVCVIMDFFWYWNKSRAWGHFSPCETFTPPPPRYIFSISI